ncbi:hypothetical protein [Methylobacter sp. BlB1]|jgi:hypothetical protein|uniref:hypothetical protein n=1 Tax=Methylobacter sp. BlB1 TaxID=2785914 RepID=UPI001892F240|nr:hypothetical protein [Methylobacter sp. BlB1]MBF6650135.1 hypothetical protein [Methylobacter sp. BlB1]
MSIPKYIPHPNREKRINSAIVAIKALLPLDMYLAHKKELLSTCIWKITEADGKLKVRYWSEGALSASSKDLRHEHVFERRELISRLLSGENIDSVVNDAVGCLVTKDEHTVLTLSVASGWNRYKDCGIMVFDSEKQEWLKIN